MGGSPGNCPEGSVPRGCRAESTDYLQRRPQTPDSESTEDEPPVERSDEGSGD